MIHKAHFCVVIVQSKALLQDILMSPGNWLRKMVPKNSSIIHHDRQVGSCKSTLHWPFYTKLFACAKQCYEWLCISMYVHSYFTYSATTASMSPFAVQILHNTLHQLQNNLYLPIRNFSMLTILLWNIEKHGWWLVLISWPFLLRTAWWTQSAILLCTCMKNNFSG